MVGSLQSATRQTQECVSVQKARELGVKGKEFEPFSALTVTVPGAAAAWEDTIKTYGKLSLKEVSQHVLLACHTAKKAQCVLASSGLVA